MAVFKSSVLLPALAALAGLPNAVEAVRNVAAPPVIVPLTFTYNTTFSTQSPGRFLAVVSLGTPPQDLSLALDISRPDVEIRHDSGVLPNIPDFRRLLFRNASSDTFIWGEPENDVNDWLGEGPVDNFTLGNLMNFRTGWNRWNHTETINISPLQRNEMLTYQIAGTLGVHGPDCAVKKGSWFTSLVANGGAPFRTWGLYFDGGLVGSVNGAPSTNLDGDNPRYSGMLLLGGYQPGVFQGNLTAVANITYNNNSPITSASLPTDPHILRIDHYAVNAQRAVAPEVREEGWSIIRPESIFSNFSTRAQAAAFAAAVGAQSQGLDNGRTVYTFPDCSAAVPTQNVEIVFPAISPDTQQKRINIPQSSLKIQKDGTCYLSFQEPWDLLPAQEQPRGVLGLSFLRNIYLHTDYDNGAYFIVPRQTGPITNPKPFSVYASPNPPKFVLSQCWNAEGTPTGVVRGEYQDSWYNFPAAFMEYYAPIVGPPWVYRIDVLPSSTIWALSVVILPVGAIFCVVLAFINNKVVGGRAPSATKKV